MPLKTCITDGQQRINLCLLIVETTLFTGCQNIVVLQDLCRLQKSSQIILRKVNICVVSSAPYIKNFDLLTGVVQNLGDLPIYLVGDTSNRKAVIVSYDIYGFDGIDFLLIYL